MDGSSDGGDRIVMFGHRAADWSADWMVRSEQPISLASEVEGTGSANLTSESVALGTREGHHLAVSVRAQPTGDLCVRNGRDECVVTHDWHAVLRTFDERWTEEAGAFARNKEVFALRMRRAVNRVARGTSVSCLVERHQDWSSKENRGLRLVAKPGFDLKDGKVIQRHLQVGQLHEIAALDALACWTVSSDERVTNVTFARVCSCLTRRRQIIACPTGTARITLAIIRGATGAATAALFDLIAVVALARVPWACHTLTGVVANTVRCAWVVVAEVDVFTVSGRS
jgi:hypothetical protein